MSLIVHQADGIHIEREIYGDFKISDFTLYHY